MMVFSDPKWIFLVLYFGFFMVFIRILFEFFVQSGVFRPKVVFLMLFLCVLRYVYSNSPSFAFEFFVHGGIFRPKMDFFGVISWIFYGIHSHSF
jgi:hypothetical protein